MTTAMIFEFISAAAPWIALGLFVAINCAFLGGRNNPPSD